MYSPKELEKIKALLKKVMELSQRGEDGERIVAQQKLDALLDKYGMSVEELSEEVKDRIFKCSGQERITILSQCIAVATSLQRKVYTSPLMPNRVFCSLSASEYITVLEMFKFYCKEYNNQKKKFLSAFLLKNDLIPTTKDSSSAINEKKIIEMYALARGISKANFKQLKKIESWETGFGIV